MILGLNSKTQELSQIFAGNTPNKYCEMAENFSSTDVDMIEMNISARNVKSGGVQFGTGRGIGRFTTSACG